MRILCCYTQLHWATRFTLTAFAQGHQIDLELTNVSANDKLYWRNIERCWTGKQDLMIVEQDIEIHGDVIPAFQSCPSLWCTFPYRLGGPDNLLETGLGCVRFRKEVQRAVTPESIQELAYGPREDWKYIDGKVASAMAILGVKVCVHQPPVKHWRKWE